jgi:hypothetical protein
VNELSGAVAGIAEVGLPLWHLASLNPGMAHARNLGENFLLFGAHPAERAGEGAGHLQSVVGSSRGRALSAAEAHRAWGERFFPGSRTTRRLPPSVSTRISLLLLWLASIRSTLRKSISATACMPMVQDDLLRRGTDRLSGVGTQER